MPVILLDSSTMTTEMSARPDTKIAVILREDLAAWQKLNMTAFLVSGVAHTAPESIGEAYADADGTKYLPMFGQPVLVFAATSDELTRSLDRALARNVVPAVFTEELFATGTAPLTQRVDVSRAAFGDCKRYRPVLLIGSPASVARRDPCARLAVNGDCEEIRDDEHHSRPRRCTDHS